MQHSSSSKRFLRGPSTQRPSHQSNQSAPRSAPRFSSQYTRDPSQKQNIDEITSFNDDDLSSSPPLPSRLRFSSSVARVGEVIDDESDDERPNINNADNEDDDLADLLYLERARGTRPGAHASKAETTPLARKRRKLSNPANEAATIFSSPSPDPAQSSDHVHPNTSPQRPTQNEDEVEPDDELSPTPARPGPLHTRFKAPKPPTPFSGSSSNVHPSFKPLADLNNASPQPTSNLPSAFSPSKRRGKADYIPGGAADTVRSWILALAAQEPVAEREYSTRFRVAEARAGRGCAVVRGQLGERWVLVHEVGENTAGVRAGAVIGVKEPGGEVELQVGRSMADDASTGGEAWKLAILWDVIG